MLGFGGPRGTTNNPNFVDGSVMALPLIARTVTTSGKRYDGDTDTFIPTIGFQGTNGIDPCPSVEVSPPIKVGSGLGISSPPDVAYRKAQKAHDPDDCERWEQDDLATTIDASGHGPRTAQAVVSEMAVRRLTPTECERLQGFPDGWTDGQPDSARYRQLGNAVCVPVAEWIGRGLMLVAHKEEVA